jgi:predicted alpha/beta hydrolase family esterase
MSSERISVTVAATLARSFLILHGYEGSGPEHWQTWLAERLGAAGERVAYPDLPDPYEPSLPAWRDALARELREGQTIVAHSLACILWLHHCSDPVGPSADRVLLVAPPSLAGAPDAIRSFFPVPLDGETTAETRLVCSENDPYCPEGAARLYGEPLGLPVDLLDGAGHINPDAGFGPWPAAEAWCYGESAIASSRIAPG